MRQQSKPCETCGTPSVAVFKEQGTKTHYCESCLLKVLRKMVKSAQRGFVSIVFLEGDK